MRRSRLARRVEKQSKKTFFLSVLGIILVIAVVIKFGIPLLINFSLLIAGSKTTETAQKTNSSSFVSPPIFNSLPDATNSAMLIVSGTAAQKQVVELFVNDKIVDKIKVKEDDSFSFEDIELQKGENTIKARTLTEEDEKSDFSNPVTVIYKDSPPSLSIDTPTDGQNFSKDDSSANVTGKSDSGVKVTVNDFWAIVNSDGTFSYNLRLKEGENKIKVVATDEAGNKSEKEIKATYSP